MCGRYTIISKTKEIAKEFNLRVQTPVAPQYNAAPSYHLPVITAQEPQELSFYRWGLIPHWAKDSKFGYKTINARSETILEKASFKMPIRRQRCLVLANCYFEWQKHPDKTKTPYLIYCMDQRLFAMAGIWDSWLDQATGEKIRSFSIITTPAVPRTQALHERMPAILPKQLRTSYLNNDLPIEQVIAMLQPYRNEQMNAMPVSDLVNSPANNERAVLQPIGERLYD